MLWYRKDRSSTMYRSSEHDVSDSYTVVSWVSSWKEGSLQHRAASIPDTFHTSSFVPQPHRDSQQSPWRYSKDTLASLGTSRGSQWGHHRCRQEELVLVGWYSDIPSSVTYEEWLRGKFEMNGCYVMVGMFTWRGLICKLRHWVTRVRGFWVQGQSLKRTLTVTDEKWLTT